jgi:hypothetical protein
MALQLSIHPKRLMESWTSVVYQLTKCTGTAAAPPVKLVSSAQSLYGLIGIRTGLADSRTGFTRQPANTRRLPITS